MGSHEFVGLTGGVVALRKVNVHFIAIEIGVVSATVSVVHSDGLFLGKNTCNMRHDRWLMKSWLSVYQKDVTV